MYLVHSLSYETKDLINDPKTKIRDYVDYRLRSQQKMVNLFEGKKGLSWKDVFDGMYAKRGDKLKDALYLEMCQFNIDMQLTKLIKEGVLAQKDFIYYRNK